MSTERDPRRFDPASAMEPPMLARCVEGSETPGDRVVYSRIAPRASLPDRPLASTAASRESSMPDRDAGAPRRPRGRHLAVVGAQWGDEGKGKVVDLLSERFDVVARFQGGPNAGHTVTIGGRRHALHHVPSGVFRPEVRVVIGNGTVIDLAALLREIDGIAESGA